MTPEQLSGILHQAQALANGDEFDAARALCTHVFAHDPGVLGAMQTYVSITRMTPQDPVLARLRRFGAATGQPDTIRSQGQSG